MKKYVTGKKKVIRSNKQRLWIRTSFVLYNVRGLAGFDIRDYDLVKIFKTAILFKILHPDTNFPGFPLDKKFKTGYNLTSESGGEDV